MSNQIKVDLDNNPITPIPKAIELLSDSTQCPDSIDFIQQIRIS